MLKKQRFSKETFASGLVGNVALGVAGYFIVVKPLLSNFGITDPVANFLAKFAINKAKKDYLNADFVKKVADKYTPKLMSESPKRYLMYTSDYVLDKQKNLFNSAKGYIDDSEVQVEEFARFFTSKFQVAQFIKYYNFHSSISFLEYAESFLEYAEIKKYMIDRWNKLPGAFSNTLENMGTSKTEQIKPFNVNV